MTYIVAVYDVGLQWGGPEEGGWWYDVGSLARICKSFRNEETAYAYARRLNAKLKSRIIGPNVDREPISNTNSIGELVAHVYEDFAPKGFPDRRPHYE